jgi:hypothetical protein
MSLKVGDFVLWEGQRDNPRLIIALDCKNKSEWPETDYQVLYLDEKVNYLAHGEKQIYKKTLPTKELIKIAKRNMKAVLKKKAIDNLTYIELLVRIKEHEQELIRA